MNRSLYFGDVADYDVVYEATGLALKLRQGAVETIIKICTGENSPSTLQLKGEISKNTSVSSDYFSKFAAEQVTEQATEQVTEQVTEQAPKQVFATGEPRAKLSADAVEYIRQVFPAMVKQCKTKNAAARILGSRYSCSSKNILAIINRRSWKHVP